VILEIIFLTGKSLLYGFVRLDVFLRSALHTDVSVFQLDSFVLKDIQATCSLVHDVDFGEDSECSMTVLVIFSRKLERIGYGKVLVDGDNAENDAHAVFDVFLCEILCDLLDVFRLI